MKKFFFILTIMMIFSYGLFCPQEAWATNMVSNPGFESQLASWTINGADWQSQGNIVFGGSQSAQVTIPNLSTSGCFETLSQVFSPATPGQFYYATAQAKTLISPLAGATAGLEIAFLNSQGNLIDYYQDTIGGLTNWKNLYLARQAPSGTAQVRIQVFVFALQGDTNAVGGSACFDDIVLDTSYIAPPVQTGLINSDFENGLNNWVKTEPYFVSSANTKLLLHADGTNGSSIFVDSSGLSHAVTANGGVQIDTAQSVFGGSSASFNGTSSYLSVPDSDDWSFGTGNFTIDFWVRFNDVSDDAIIVSQYVDGNNKWFIRKTSSNKLAVTFTFGGVDIGSYDTATSSGMQNNTWHHLAFVRSGANAYLFVDGISQALIVSSNFGINNVGNLAAPLQIGRYGTNSSYDWQGHIDEMRIVKGAAQWTSNFTPPTAPYSGGTPSTTWTTEQSPNSLNGLYSAKHVIDMTTPLDPSATNYYAKISQVVPAAPNTTYYATLKLKNNINVTAQAQAGLLIEFLDQYGNLLGNSSDTIGNATITKTMYVAATSPANTATIVYNCTVWAPLGDTAANGAQVLFDDGILTTNYIAPPALPSALQNPGFEQGFASWNKTEPNFINGTPASWSLEQTSPLIGAYSAKNTIDIANLDPSATSYYATVSQEVSATAGQTYYSTLQMKNNISVLAQAQAGLLIEFLDAGGTVLSGSQDIFGNTAGVAKTMYVAAAAPAGTAKIRYSCLVFAPLGDTAANGGEAFFDEGVLTTTYIAPPSSPSVLQNPGFELGYNNWTKTEPYLITGTPVTWTIDQSSPITGTYSAMNTINMADLDSLASSYYGTVSQEISAVAGQTYYATLNALSNIDPTAHAKVGLKLEFINSFGQIITLPAGTVDSDVIGGNTPTRLLYVAVTAPTGAAKVRYNCMVWAPKTDIAADGGTVLFDDAVLTTTYIAPPIVTNLVNGDCENGLNDWDVIEPALSIPNPSSSWEAQDSQAYQGTLANKNTINMSLTGSTDYYAALTQTIPVTGNTPVYASVMIKTDFHPASSAKAGLRIEFYDANDNLTGWLPPGTATYATVSGTSAWQQKKVQGLTPLNSVKMKYILYVFAYNNDNLAGGTTAFFDDAQLSFIYINNISHHPDPYIQQYQYPVELAQNSYHTAPALIRSTISYLYPAVYFPSLPALMSQTDLYNTYHVGNPGGDFQPSEIKTAMNTQLQGIGVSFWGYNPFHYEDWYQTTSQIDAVKNFIYWIDYFVASPGAAFYCPAFVPVNGNLQWRLVKGFTSDAKPHPVDGTIVPFTVLGLWVNDPTTPGLGYDIYQTPAAFQADYLPVSGQYRSVYEPPLNLNRQVFYSKLTKVKASLAAVQPNPELKTEITRLAQKNKKNISEAYSLVSVQSLSRLGSMVDTNIVFNKDYLKEALPKALKHDVGFMLLFEGAESIRQFEVYDKSKDKNYLIFALDSRDKAISISKNGLPLQANKTGSLISGELKTRILIEVDPNTGAFLQATWNAKGETYPRVSKEQAIQQVQAKTEGAYLKNTKLTASNARLVWARDLKTSRFHPAWEVVVANKPVIVNKAAMKDVLTSSVLSGGNATTSSSTSVDSKAAVSNPGSFERNKPVITTKTK